MGIWMSRMLSYFGEKEARILVLGLDNAGKTTILCKQAVPHRSAVSWRLQWPHTAVLHTCRPATSRRSSVNHSK
jgi:ADP-ribosylation factor-like protein 1